jgi:hypothetical protein
MECLGLAAEKTEVARLHSEEDSSLATRGLFTIVAMTQGNEVWMLIKAKADRTAGTMPHKPLCHVALPSPFADAHVHHQADDKVA